MTNFKIKVIDNGASSEILKNYHSVNKKLIAEWLLEKKIILRNDDLLEYEDIEKWTRKGSETYCSSFKIKTESFSKQIIIKALVTMTPNDSIADWNRRREFLKRNKISVSHWYYYGDGIIIEDYYPYVAYEAVPFNKLLEIGHKLDNLGFTTLNFINDIRSDTKGYPYYIDFGFDLGEPSQRKNIDAKENLLKLFPHKKVEIETYYA